MVLGCCKAADGKALIRCHLTQWSRVVGVVVDTVVMKVAAAAAGGTVGR